MGLRYGKKSYSGEESGTMWTSYSDLFLALSVIFLLLYVVASLKQSTNGLLNSVEQQRLTREVEELKSQMRVYNTLKEDYMEKEANNDDKKTYEELTNKLSLLQDEARQEKEDLRAQATENEKKERALNHYQKLVQSIINANMLAQSRIKKRDTIIEKKDQTISERTKEIKSLEKSIREKEGQIRQSEEKISSINSELAKRLKQLRNAYTSQKISKKKFENEMARIKDESESRVAELREKEAAVKGQLSNVKGQLESATSELQSAKTTIVKQSAEKEKLASELEGTTKQFSAVKGQLEATSSELESAKTTIEKQGAEKEKLAAELEGASQKYANQIAGLKGEFEAQRKRDRAAFDKELAGQKLSAAQRAQKEAEFRAGAARKEAELGGKIAALNSKVKDTEGQLARARVIADAKKKLIAHIKGNLAAGGISADVDPNTGDVVLNFGEQYFDTGRADLKPAMRQIIEKAVPLYSKSLFQDPKIADKIASVEIMGFASPTYKGKYIDPGSLKPEDKKAVDYNMDLSYERAKRIFQYVFDTDKMQFSHQKQLYPLVKVSGRSYLAEAKKGARGVASGTTGKEFCQNHDCVKAQRVIIKFTMKD